jgi:hypothetical protein
MSKIEKINEEIKNFEHGRMITNISNVLYQIQMVSVQIYMFEHNAVESGKNKEYTETLTSNIFAQCKNVISEYASLFAAYSNSNAEEIKLDAINNTENIIKKNSISFNEKYKKLSELIIFYGNEFSKNFNIKQKRWIDNKELNKNNEKLKRFWDIIYILFQIIGLIFIGAAELINNFYLFLFN